jgi:hypothetical protein
VNHKPYAPHQGPVDGADCPAYRGTSLIRNRPPPPKEHHRALGTGLLQGPGGVHFLVSEVPLHAKNRDAWLDAFHAAAVERSPQA